MSISLVTWIWNRCHQYSQVLPVNLSRAPAESEFILLDVGSTDGLREYVQTIDDPRLRVIDEMWPVEARNFARLYNRVASFARGDILAFVDADNAIGPEYCDALSTECVPGQFVWAFSGNWSDGTPGRLAFHREDFARLGGFDEHLGPVGYQDLDLVYRAKAMGIRLRYFQRSPVVGYAIQNTKDDTGRAVGLSGSQYMRQNKIAAKQSQANIAAGRLVANLGGGQP